MAIQIWFRSLHWHGCLVGVTDRCWLRTVAAMVANPSRLPSAPLRLLCTTRAYCESILPNTGCTLLLQESTRRRKTVDRKYFDNTVTICNSSPSDAVSIDDCLGVERRIGSRMCCCFKARTSSRP